MGANDRGTPGPCRPVLFIFFTIIHDHETFRGAQKERAVHTHIEGIEEKIRNRIAEIVGPQKYKIWFKNSTQFSLADGILKVGVPNLFIGSFIEDHFAEVIQQAVSETVPTPVQISYVIDPVLFRKLRKTQFNSQAAFIEQSAERAARDSENGSNGNGHAGNGNGHSAHEPKPRKLRGRLDQFVVGANNRLAHSMALSIVEDPLADTTPLFVHSGCGLGKTHLLQGIANALSEKQPDIRWLYVSGEEFTNQFILALRERKLDAFRHRFREIDVLLLDDMQFIANKKATQEEFLHTFNAINANAKRVVLASDAHPKMMSDLSESLTSRLVAGMVVKIDRPDRATRCEILRRRAAITQHQVPAPVIEYIADKINASVRELEGCLVKLLAYASLTKSQVTLDLARQALDDHLTQTGKLLTISDIEQNVATFFGLTPADLHTSRKSRTIALARNIAMHLARKHTTYSFPEIARFMGNKNHTTVLLACRRINASLTADAEVSWQSAAGVQKRKLRELVEAHEQHLFSRAPQLPAPTARAHVPAMAPVPAVAAMATIPAIAAIA